MDETLQNNLKTIAANQTAIYNKGVSDGEQKVIDLAIDDTLSKENVAADAKATGDAIHNLAIKNKASGSLLTLPDSAEQPFKSMKVFGKTKQVSTTGKNLLPYPYEESSVASRFGVAITVNNDGSILLNGTSTSSQVTNFYFHFTNSLTLPAGTYKCGGVASSDCYMMIYDPTISEYRSTKNQESISLTLTEESQVAILIQWSANAVINNVLVKPFIVKAEEYDGVWEPYTGGMPSPNPNYPQALESVGDSGSVEQFVKGNNFIDYTKAEIRDENNTKLKIVINNDGSVTYTGDYYFRIPVSLQRGKKYSLSFDGGGIKNGWCYAYSGSRNISSYGKSGGSISTKTDEDALYIYIYPYDGFGTITTTTISNIRLNEGIVVKPYEPYKSQSLTISTPNGLPGVPVSSGGNYTDENGQQWICDEVDFERGVLVQNIFRGEINENSNIVSQTAGTNSFKRFAVSSTEFPPCKIISNNTAPTICTHLKYNLSPIGDGSINNTICAYGVGNNGLYLVINEFETAEELKAWLVDNPMQCAYPLAEPIETPLPEEEIEAYKALHTNYPNTTIYNNDGAGTEVEYVADTKNYVDNKIATEVAKLTAAIITE